MNKEVMRLLDLCHLHLRAPVWLGVEDGGYQLSIDLEGSQAIRAELSEVVLIRQVDRLISEICRGSELIDRSDNEAAWNLLNPPRCVDCIDGGYTVIIRDESELTYYLTEWNCDTLRRYDKLLGKVLEANRSLIEQL